MLFLNRKQPVGFGISQGSVADAVTWTGDNYRPASRPLVIETPAAAEKRTCGSMECISARPSPWRNRKRPIFEGMWGCSGRCVLAMVRAAVRRETGDGLEMVHAKHQHRLPLGLLMLAQGWVTHPQLQYALSLQKMRGGRIGDLLVEECGIDREQVTRALSMQWSCPVLVARGFSANSMALVAPKIFIEQFGVVPLRVAGSSLLYLGFEDHLDAATAFALEQMTGLKAESGLMPTEEYREARAALMRQPFVTVEMERIAEADALAARITAILEQKQPIASKLVRMHQYLWLRLWLEPSSRGKKGTVPRSHEDMLDYIFTVGR
jgi:hypothetical protein